MKAPVQTTAARPAADATAARRGILQRCACGGKLGPSGECAECRRKRLLQTKLVVNAPGDRYEQEADRVADAVLRMPAPEAGHAPIRVQRVRREDGLKRQDDDESERIQAKAHQGRAPDVAPEVEAQVDALRGRGRPLPAEVRAYMEPRFGYDFSRVRIHTDGRAAEAARSVHARAFAVGSDVVFGAGAFRPEADAGRRLLAHELTHTLQQRPGSAPAQQAALSGGGAMHPAAPPGRAEKAGQDDAAVARAPGTAAFPGFSPAVHTLPRPDAQHTLARNDDEPDVDTGEEAQLDAKLRRLLRALLGEDIEAVMDEVEADPDLVEFEGMDSILGVLLFLQLEKLAIETEIANGEIDAVGGRLELARLRREELLYSVLMIEAWRDGELPYTSADEAIADVKAAAETEEATLIWLDYYSTSPEETGEILNVAVTDFEESFPLTNVEMYRVAEAMLQERADAYSQDFEKVLTRWAGADVEEVIRYFVWLMNGREKLRKAARLVGLTPVIQLGGTQGFGPRRILPNIFEPATLETSGGFKPEDIELVINEAYTEKPAFEEEVRGTIGDDLFSLLDTWFHYRYYDGLAAQMKLLRIAVEATLQTNKGEPADIERDLLRTYAGHSAGLDVTEKGFDEVYDRLRKRLDQWAQSLSEDERVVEGFGLYDVLGEVGQQLKQLATPEAAAMMVGFIAFLIAIQFVPYANVVVDVILLALGGIDILKGLVIFGTYFERARDAQTFRNLYMAAQGLKGGGEAVLDLLFELLGLAAAKAIKSFKRYRDVKRFENLDEAAPIIDEMAGKVPAEDAAKLRESFAKAKRTEGAFRPWEQRLHPDAQDALSRDPDLRRLYGEMDPDVRRLFMRCKSPCQIQLDPPPKASEALRINRLLDDIKYKSLVGADKTRVETKLKTYLQARTDTLSQAITDIQTPGTRQNLEALLDYFNAGGRVLGRADSALVAELQKGLVSLRAKTGVVRGRNAGGAVTGGTVGIAKSDVPQLAGKVFEGLSPQAGGSPHPGFKPPSSHPSAQGHAEQNLAGAIDDELKKVMASSPSLKPADFSGTVWMHIEQPVCSGCKAGLADPDSGKGVLKQFSEKYPNLTLEITAEGTTEIVGVRKGIRILR